MSEQADQRRWYHNDTLHRAIEWLVLLMVLMAALWAGTRTTEAPQLILLTTLTIITINFSLPPKRGAVGLVPLVSVSSLLILGLETAVLLLIISIILAELAGPLWKPLWEYVDLKRPSWRQRLGADFIYLLTLIIAGQVYRLLGGTTPLTALAIDNLDWSLLITLAVVYGLVYFLLTLLAWVIMREPLAEFFSENAVPILTFGLLVQPFALLGSITYIRSGLPVFVIYALGVTVFAVVVWLSWQRRFILQRQLAQFSALNRSGASLRETLELEQVLMRTYELVTELVPVDQFTIALLDEQGVWQRPFRQAQGKPIRQVQTSEVSETSEVAYAPDDFTRWVAENKKLLDTDYRNIHFAARHGLTLPQPKPNAWLGIPLTAVEQVIGVMVLQRYPPQPPFSHWNRQVLLAIAGQASAAIQNARLYSETLRLYNLTDEALAQRVKQLQALLNSMKEGVLMIDTQGRVVLVNPPAAHLLGQASEALLLQGFLPEETAVSLGFSHTALQTLLDHLHSNQLPPAQQVEFQTAAGQTFLRLDAPVLAANGQAIGWLMLFRNITEERELAERRTDLTRMIVHDLRNPLTTLASTISLLEHQLLPENGTIDGNFATTTSLLQTADMGVADMLDMVDSLMDINRMEAGQEVVDAEAMHLPPLAAQVVARLQPWAQERRIALAFADSPSDLPAVWGDAEVLRRVFINLLDNALKFTPSGGSVNGRFLPDTNSITGYEPGIICIIQDTGPGIPPESREQVFERFTRTNQGGAPIRGTGLGLTFCKLVIEAHNGRIWVEDNPAGGSQFVFTLPGMPIFEGLNA
ncbi:MAG: GAF domain-containing sensor histidine kinase [Anaerolineae bacterium]|nr:GAF domain-containing sensor histidine kinase [Anaerolineae bacterium]